MFSRFVAFFLLSITLCSSLYSQPLSCYTNLRNQVMAWDNGIIRKIDYLPPTTLLVGRTTIPYIDNAQNFKIYYNGGVQMINKGFTNLFYVSDNLVTFMNANSLNVFDNGTVKNLSGLCKSFYMGDSLVLFLDGVRNEYKAYYNGDIYPIENYLAGSALDTASSSSTLVQVSDNIAAYVNYANQFHIFYHGEIIGQEDYQVTSFAVGRNTVAYEDANREFKVFQNGATQILEDYAPYSYKVGDNLVAYVGNDGYFKIFYNDSIYRMGFLNPTYQVVDNIVTYQDVSGYFKVFYKGNTYTLESYYPEDGVEIKYNSLVYKNQANMLRMFSFGETYDVSSADVESWTLYYDVLQYQIGQNIYRTFYKGKDYY